MTFAPLIAQLRTCGSIPSVMATSFATAIKIQQIDHEFFTGSIGKILNQVKAVLITSSI